MGGALRGVRLRAGSGGRQPVKVRAAARRSMPVVTAHAGGGVAVLRYCAALLRAAVPAGAQREGLNVHLPRESRPLEVAAEV